MNGNSDNRRLVIGLIGGALLILMTMVTSIFLVSRRPVVVVVPGGVQAEGSGQASASAVAPTAGTVAASEAPLPVISVSKIASVPDMSDPLNPAWESVAVSEIPLAPQQVAPPTLEKGTVATLRVQAVRDDSRYAWRLSWEKSKPAESSDVSTFTDAVAMQFPLVDGAPYTMGGPGLPVRMLYWKAVWQKDVDKGFQGLAGVHPNSHSDLYWFSEGKEPHAADGTTDSPQARQFMVASQSNNPMTDYNRKHPIEELTAHGFGSGTHVEGTPSRGRGVWSEGRWYVVIDRPVAPEDPLIKRFNESPDKQLIAFAVWDGDNANRGGVKQITNWIPLTIAQ